MAGTPQENQQTHSQLYNTHADSYDLPLHGALDDKHVAGPKKNLIRSEEKVALRTLSARPQPSDWN